MSSGSEVDPATANIFASFMKSMMSAAAADPNLAATASTSSAAPTQVVPQTRTMWGVSMVKEGNYLDIGGAFLKGKFDPEDFGSNLPDEVVKEIADFSIDDDMWAKFEAFASLIAFQGFDPRVIKGLLWERFSKGITKPDAGLFVHEVTMMIILFVQRGSAILKMQDRSSDEGATVMRAFVEKYKLTTAAGNRSKNVTLPRVAQSFPEIVATVLVRMPALRTIGNGNVLHRGLMFSGGASLIPKGTRLVVSYLAWAKTQDAILNRRGKGAGQRDEGRGNTGQVARRDNSWFDYVRIAMDSDLIGAAERLIWCAAIIQEEIQDGRIKQFSNDVAECYNYIQDEYSGGFEDELEILGDDVKKIKWEDFGLNSKFEDITKIDFDKLAEEDEELKNMTSDEEAGEEEPPAKEAPAPEKKKEKGKEVPAAEASKPAKKPGKKQK